MNTELDLFGNPVPLDTPVITVTARKAPPAPVPAVEPTAIPITEDQLRAIQPFTFFKETPTKTWIINQ